MRVNNLPRVALDSGEAGIRTRDLLIASPASQPLGHRATQHVNCFSSDSESLTDDTAHVALFNNNELQILFNYSGYSITRFQGWGSKTKKDILDKDMADLYSKPSDDAMEGNDQME